MQILKTLFRKEYNHFYLLGNKAQLLGKSILLHNITTPIFAIFINAFLWRQSQSLIIVSLYNLAFFAAIPFGFYLNGLLLKRFYPAQLLYIGSIFKASTVLLLMLFPFVTEMITILFGLLYGLAAGMFYFNRNLMTLRVTSRENRIYFSSLDSVSNTLMGIIIPVFIGWFLLFGTNYHLYTPIHGYYIIGILTVLIGWWSGNMIKNLNVHMPRLTKVTLDRHSPIWTKMRSAAAIFGLVTGVMSFLPTIIILSLIGKEDTLGLIQSIAAILAALIIYYVAKAFGPQYRIRMIGASTFCSLIGALLFSVLYSGLGIFLLLITQMVSLPLLYMAMTSLIHDTILKESRTEEHNYHYLFDFELFLGIGRIIGIVLFFFYINVYSTDFAMRYTPLFLGFSQLALILTAVGIEKRYRTAPVQISATQDPSSGIITP